MKIEFGVQEYFNELKLMDAQFGQEEELYPWIYMLLQMAECRKGKQYKGVSIRDVHKGVKATGDSELKKKLYSIGGFPDFAILNMEATREKGGSLLGCVEIKKYEIKNELIKMKEKKECEDIKIDKEKGSQISLIINRKNILEKLSCGEEELDKAILNVFEKEYKQINQQINQRRDNRYYTTVLSEVEMENKRCEEIDKGVEEIKTAVIIKLNNKEYTIDGTIRRECVEKINYESNLNCENKDQIIKHLYKAKKVLYTNGLQFYFLNLTENEEKIEVEKLADLSKYYNNYNPKDEWKEKEDAEKEWGELIKRLTSIDWHKEPVAEISSAQPSTEE